MHVLYEQEASAALGVHIQHEGVPAAELMGNAPVHGSTPGIGGGGLHLESIHPTARGSLKLACCRQLLRRRRARWCRVLHASVLQLVACPGALLVRGRLQVQAFEQCRSACVSLLILLLGRRQGCHGASVGEDREGFPLGDPTQQPGEGAVGFGGIDVDHACVVIFTASAWPARWLLGPVLMLLASTAPHG